MLVRSLALVAIGVSVLGLFGGVTQIERSDMCKLLMPSAVLGAAGLLALAIVERGEKK